VSDKDGEDTAIDDIQDPSDDTEGAWSPGDDLLEESGEDQAEEAIITNDGDDLASDVSADSGSRLQVMVGTDREANVWNTELQNILQHKEDVLAGRAESGQQIMNEVYGLEGPDDGDDLDETPGSR